MNTRIGVRREGKSVWERRVPIVPEHVGRLIAGQRLDVWVQSSRTRVFSDHEFGQAGARIREDLSLCPVVFGVKEMPASSFQPGHTYAFFAHVTKGQPYNMPMLRRLMELGCTLVDYEKVTDERGQRLIFFGRHAGLAGMLDTLRGLGQRLEWEGIPTPFSSLRQTYQYESLAEAKAAVMAVGERIARNGLPEQITPLICGFAGYGNVFRGANEIIELLPLQEIQPAEIEAVAAGSDHARDKVFKVVFREEHTVTPTSPARGFELQDFYTHPELYCSRFNSYMPHLTVLVNCVYWQPQYPRLVTKAGLRQLYEGGRAPRLRIIGDISCDIEGAIEATLKSTEPDHPVFVYDPLADAVIDGIAGHGPVIMAVDILPSELPRESSEHFSEVLMQYVPAIAHADYAAPFEELDLPAEVRRAVIVHRGQLTPDYRYLAEHLKG